MSFIIWILEDSVWNAWQPWLFEKISRKETKDVEAPWKILMHGFGLISWFLVMLAPEAVLILGGRRYADVIWLITPMVTGALSRFYSYSYTAIQKDTIKKTGYVAHIGTLMAMVVNVILNYICILLFGYQAAAYTTAVSYFLLLYTARLASLRSPDSGSYRWVRPCGFPFYTLLSIWSPWQPTKYRGMCGIC